MHELELLFFTLTVAGTGLHFPSSTGAFTVTGVLHIKETCSCWRRLSWDWGQFPVMELQLQSSTKLLSCSLSKTVHSCSWRVWVEIEDSYLWWSYSWSSVQSFRVVVGVASGRSVDIEETWLWWGYSFSPIHTCGVWVAFYTCRLGVAYGVGVDIDDICECWSVAEL